LHRDDAQSFFLQLNGDRADFCSVCRRPNARLWRRLLAPDDAADLIQEAPAQDRAAFLAMSTMSRNEKSKFFSTMPKTMPAA
jgi:magnesium transporter